MRYARRFPTAAFIITLLAIAAPAAVAQDEQPVRANIPTITVLERGTEPRFLHRWDMARGGGGIIQLTSRTGQIPSRAGRVDPDSLERMYTLQGSFFRTMPVRKMSWQILNASAKLSGDAERSPKFAKPGEDPAGPLNGDTEPAEGSARDLTGSGEARGIDPKAEAHTRARLRLRNTKLSLQKITDGILRQEVGPNGIMAGGTVAILENQTARAYSEAMKLSNLIGLFEVLLPDEPIGVGARWQASFRIDSTNTPLDIEMTWTLKSIEDSRMTLEVGYTRRLASAANDPRTQANRSRVERNGRGTVSIDLNRPLAIVGDLVEERVYPAHFTAEQRRAGEATWISARPVPTPVPSE